MDQVPTWWAIIPVSALVSALVTLAIRFVDKPRPRLRLIGRYLVLPADARLTDMYGHPTTLHNFGNGPAYGVRIAGSGCVVGVRMPKAHTYGGDSWADHLHAVEPGESVVLDVNNLDDWDAARIVVTWDRFPSFPALSWLRRSRTFRVGRLPVENPLPPMSFPTQTIPWYRRRLGAVARFGLSRRMSDEADQRGTGGPPSSDDEQ